MAVSHKIEHLPGSVVKVTFTLENADVRAGYDRCLAKLSKNVQIPGFRKGKVPRNVLERKLGESVKNDALLEIMEDVLQNFFKSDEIPAEDLPLPRCHPSLGGELPTLDVNAELSFAVSYDVMPVVTLKEWKGYTVETKTAEITEEDVARELEKIRERNAVVLDRDEGAKAADKDVVTVNYCELGEDGEPVEGSKREDFVFTLGSGNNLYKFDAEIVGMAKGETRDFEKTWPADFEEKYLAGQTTKLRVTLTALKEKQLPELDDELAQDVDEKYKTLDDLKNVLRSKLTEQLEHRLRELRLTALMEKIIAANPFDVPESMVHLEVRTYVQRMLGFYDGVREDVLDKLVEETLQKGAEQDVRGTATRNLQAAIIMQKIAADEHITASEDEVTQEIERRGLAAAGLSADSASDQKARAIEDARKYYEGEGARESLKTDIVQQKVADLVLAENTINAGEKVAFLDIMA